MSERIKLDLDEEIDELFGGPPTLLDKIWWSVYSLFSRKLNPIQWYRHTKWFIQRGRRGYSDRDVWNLYQYAAKVLRGSLIQLANESLGYPGEDTEWPTHEDWSRDLLEVAGGLNHYILATKFEETCTCCGNYCNDMECPIVIETFQKLFEMWPGLWD